eukprot:scaffold5521_cov358-Prasinococcus_capsulatus_cf.AAC.4
MRLELLVHLPRDLALLGTHGVEANGLLNAGHAAIPGLEGALLDDRLPRDGHTRAPVSGWVPSPPAGPPGTRPRVSLVRQTSARRGGGVRCACRGPRLPGWRPEPPAPRASRRGPPCA